MTDNLPIRIYRNKVENRITIRTKAWYHLEFLISKMMKLLGSTKSKTTKDENGENVPYWETSEIVLVNNYYQQDSRVLYTFVPNK